MRLLSNSIVNYIYLNYDISENTSTKEFDNVKKLVINSLNYSLEEERFYPIELSYFNNLEECTFINFILTDEIIEYINNANLKILSLDNCNCNINNILNVEEMYIENSQVNLEKINAKKLTILDGNTINIQNFINSKIKNLTLLNSNLINTKLLKNLEECKITIIGCTIDDSSIKFLNNINYDSNKYEKVS